VLMETASILIFGDRGCSIEKRKRSNPPGHWQIEYTRMTSAISLAATGSNKNSIVFVCNHNARMLIRWLLSKVHCPPFDKDDHGICVRNVHCIHKIPN